MDGRETWLSWRAAPHSAILPVQEIESENVTVNACTTSAVDIGDPMFQTPPLPLLLLLSLSLLLSLLFPYFPVSTATVLQYHC